MIYETKFLQHLSQKPSFGKANLYIKHRFNENSFKIKFLQIIQLHLFQMYITPCIILYINKIATRIIQHVSYKIKFFLKKFNTVYLKNHHLFKTNLSI